MNNKKYIVLMMVFVIIGSVYIANSKFNEDNFCLWGFSCEGVPDEYYSMDSYYSINELENYTFKEDGIISSSFSEEDAAKNIIKSIDKVIINSRRDYQELITLVSAGEDFTEIFNGNMKIFSKRYTTDLDMASPTQEYIQDIGELVINGYRGDCDDYALFLYLIATERGLKARYTVGINEYSGHAWVEIMVDGEWKEYDSTSNRICDDCISMGYDYIDYFEEDEDE